MAMTNDCQMVWDNCLRTIKKNVNPQSFKTWFEPIRPVHLDSSTLTIQVPNKFFYEWLEEHYVQLLKTSIRQELGDRGRLQYHIPENGVPTITMAPMALRAAGKPSAEKDNEPTAGSFNAEKIKNPIVIPGIKSVKIDQQLNLKYKVESVMEGD